MTVFEMEQMDEFVHTIERHLEDWLLTRRDMQKALRELTRIEQKLRKVISLKGYPADRPSYSPIIEDLQQRAAACRSSIYERLMI